MGRKKAPEGQKPYISLTEHNRLLMIRENEVRATHRVLTVAEDVAKALIKLGVPAWAAVPRDGSGWADAATMHHDWPEARWVFYRKIFRKGQPFADGMFRVDLRVGGRNDNKPYGRRADLETVHWSASKSDKYGSEIGDISENGSFVHQGGAIVFPAMFQRVLVGYVNPGVIEGTNLEGEGPKP